MDSMDELMFKNGQALGPYRIVRCIGRGGMGEVYEVEHEGLGVRYALKAFAYRGGESWPMLRAKFMEEGQVLARLRHPNLVRVFDLTIDGETGTAYYVMDLVLYKDGNPYTLDDVDRTSAGEDHLFIWFRDLCNALDYVHSHGVVHRDVKLNNVLLNADKHVTLSDFGIAHIFGDGMVKAPAGACVTGAFYATGERRVLGTDCYMAPEVADGGEATPAADTYALGVAMFKMLTGVWYEPGMDARALLAGRRWKYRWTDVLPDMLETEPTARPQILAQAVIGLVPRKKPASANGSAKRRMRRDRQVWIATALVCAALVVGGGLLAWLLMMRIDEAKTVPEVKAAARKERPTTPLAEETQPKETSAQGMVEEGAAANRKADNVEAPRPEADTRRKTEEENAKAQENPKSSIDDNAKAHEAKEYRWRDVSGEPQEVSFEIGDGCVARLVPLKADSEAFWMSRLPITVASWRAVNGGFDELKPLEAALPEEFPLGVLMDKSEAEAFCRAMTEKFRLSFPEGCEVRLATEEETRSAIAETDTAKMCEATGRGVNDCVGSAGAVAAARFRRLKAECRLDRFGEWTGDGRLSGKSAAVAGLPMTRASGIIGLSTNEAKSALRHFVVGRRR